MGEQFPPDTDWAAEMRRTAECLRDEGLPGMGQVIAGNEAIARHIESLRARLKTAENLADYADHSTTCPRRDEGSTPRECDCGLDEVSKAFLEAEEGSDG